MHPSSNRYSGAIEALAGRLFRRRKVLDAEGGHFKGICLRLERVVRSPHQLDTSSDPSNPQPPHARAAYPAPVPTPPTEPPSLTLWIWACLLAHVDLLPQREIGRHVQRTSPYDGHRVDPHPMSSLGLTRTRRAPFVSLLNPSSMMSSAYPCPTYPRPRIPVPE
jgi:hypothetical protein